MSYEPALCESCGSPVDAAHAQSECLLRDPCDRCLHPAGVWCDVEDEEVTA